LSVQAEIAAGGGRRVWGRRSRGGGARRGRESERAARGRVERRAAGRAAAASVYDVRWDINADGAVTWADYNHYPDISMGRGVLSHVGNRFGYAGYQHAPELAGAKWHVRNRMLDSVTGVWNRRDPLGYVDGMNLYQYVRSMPLVLLDVHGLSAIRLCSGTLCCGWGWGSPNCEMVVPPVLQPGGDPTPGEPSLPQSPVDPNTPGPPVPPAPPVTPAGPVMPWETVPDEFWSPEAACIRHLLLGAPIGCLSCAISLAICIGTFNPYACVSSYAACCSCLAEIKEAIDTCTSASGGTASQVLEVMKWTICLPTKLIW
jgi:RHS repeat-associated protein